VVLAISTGGDGCTSGCSRDFGDGFKKTDPQGTKGVRPLLVITDEFVIPVEPQKLAICLGEITNEDEAE
jgi:hypothetical protein